MPDCNVQNKRPRFGEESDSAASRSESELESERAFSRVEIHQVKQRVLEPRYENLVVTPSIDYKDFAGQDNPK